MFRSNFLYNLVMTNNLKDQVVKDSLNLGQSLERIRDSFHTNVKEGLFYQTISLYLVNFCVRYSILLHELIEKKVEEGDMVDSYKTIIGIQGDSRYLFELFLTTCHILAKPEDKREVVCLSLRLSELLHVNKQDLIIHEMNPGNNTEAKIASNQEVYVDILKLAKQNKIDTLPRDLDDCKPHIIKSAGLFHYSNAKVIYSDELKNNPEVKLALNNAREKFERIAQPLYASFSLYEHPSYASVKKLNGFIKLSMADKFERIELEKFQTLSMIKPVAKAMEFTCNKNLF
jgi:hypothetical protein